MSNSNQTVKAIRATIKLGNIELDVYQMPDGCYKFSVTQAAKACNLAKQRVSEIWGKKSVKALLPEGLKVSETYLTTSVETAGGIQTASLIDLEYVTILWMGCSTPEGQALAHACMAESLERRADAAFAVERTEVERNEVFAVRMDLVNRLVKLKRAKVTKANYAIYMADLAEATEVEQKIATAKTLMNDTLKRMDKFMTSTKNTEYQAMVYSWDVAGLETYRAELETLGVSC